MKKNLILFLLITVLISISCKTTPEEVETLAVSEPSGSLTAQAKIKAEEARKRAMDFDTHTYRPSEWDAVETIFNSSSTVVGYEAAAAAYNELFEKTHPLYAKAREDEILSVRDELIDTGMTPLFPEEFRAADRKALDAMDQYEAGDYYPARASALKALDEYEAMLLFANMYKTRDQLINTGVTGYFPQYLYRADDIASEAIDQYKEGDIDKSKETGAKAKEEYETLLLGAEVYLVRQDIIALGFDNYISADFNRADESFLAAIDDYAAGNREAAIDKAEEAMLRYRIVLSDGWVYYSNDKKDAASSERQNAIDERANIASREYFREADAYLAEAERLFAAGDSTGAAIAFTNAEAMYAISIQDTLDKRSYAEQLIRQANEIIESSNESALEAERIIEGGSR